MGEFDFGGQVVSSTAEGLASGVKVAKEAIKPFKPLTYLALERIQAATPRNRFVQVTRRLFMEVLSTDFRRDATNWRRAKQGLPPV